MKARAAAAVLASGPRMTRSRAAAASASAGPLTTAHDAAAGSAASTLASTSTSASASASTSAPAAPTSALPTLFFPSAPAWEAWLSAQTDDAARPPPDSSSGGGGGSARHAGVWLRLAKKASGVASVSYDAAVDAALCHGWIDGQRRRCDVDGSRFFLQRFTPRRRRSPWSRRNVARVQRLVADGSMREAGLREVAAARRDGRWERAY